MERRAVLATRLAQKLEPWWERMSSGGYVMAVLRGGTYSMVPYSAATTAVASLCERPDVTRIVWCGISRDGLLFFAHHIVHRRGAAHAHALLAHPDPPAVFAARPRAYFDRCANELPTRTCRKEATLKHYDPFEAAAA